MSPDLYQPSRRTSAVFHRQVLVTLHHHRVAHVEHALVGSGALAQFDLAAGNRMAAGKRRSRNAGRMDAEGGRPGFGRAVAVVDQRLWEDRLDLVDQGLRERCRAHRDVGYRREIQTADQVALARDERQHRRHRGQPCHREPFDRPGIELGIERRQQDDARSRLQGHPLMLIVAFMWNIGAPTI